MAKHFQNRLMRAYISDIAVDITCDNQLWFYADDQEYIGSSTPDYDDWQAVKHVDIPGNTKVYGIKCVDTGSVAGILASFSDGSITNGEDWR